jgi:hypothetical protein
MKVEAAENFETPDRSKSIAELSGLCVKPMTKIMQPNRSSQSRHASGKRPVRLSE